MVQWQREETVWKYVNSIETDKRKKSVDTFIYTFNTLKLVVVLLI